MMSLSQKKRQETLSLTGKRRRFCGELELVDKSGKPCLVVKIDISIQSLSEFMKSVNEEVAKLTKVKGLDAAQKATTLIPKLGAALEKIVPVIDKFAGVSPSSFEIELLSKIDE
ncbi:hypothetical protein HWV62_20556 [Athelia sp. TMB]|nr:hypothetical protein HWV62_20556 [Athelia sp. TMB]